MGISPPHPLLIGVVEDRLRSIPYLVIPILKVINKRIVFSKYISYDRLQYGGLTFVWLSTQSNGCAEVFFDFVYWKNVKAVIVFKTINNFMSANIEVLFSSVPLNRNHYVCDLFPIIWNKSSNINSSLLRSIHVEFAILYKLHTGKGYIWKSHTTLIQPYRSPRRRNKPLTTWKRSLDYVP